MTYRFSDESLTIEDAAQAENTTWSQITALHRLNGLCLLITRRRTFYILPARALASHRELEQFLTLANQHIQPSP